MPLTLQQQFDLAMRSVTGGDLDLFAKLLTDPDTILPDEQRTVAQKLGIHGGLLSATVNTLADPVVWLSFWMSKRFPTLSWLKGTIPERMVGAANDWTGIGSVARPVEQYFRGTNIPKLVALAETRKAKVLQIGQRMFERMSRPNWQQEMQTVSMLLEGQPVAASPALERVAAGLRGDMEEIWGLLQQTQQIRGGLEGTEITRAQSGPFPPGRAPRHLRDYLPHIPLLGEQDIVQLSGREALQRLGGHRLGQALRAAGENPAEVWRPDVSDRLASHFDRYQQFLNSTQGQVYNPRLFRRLRQDIVLASHQGQELFVTDLNVILEKYVSSAARTYAINAPISDFERTLATVKVLGEDGVERSVVPSNEPVITQIINQGIDATGARLIRRPVRGTNIVDEVVDPGSHNPLAMSALRDLVRAVSGKADEGEIRFGNLFSAVGRRFDHAVGAITGRRKAEADAMIRAFRRNQAYRPMVNGITSFFYGTTLGLNPWSALQNLMQPLLTTLPALGPGPMLAGFRELEKRIPRYAREIRIQHAALRGAAAADEALAFGAGPISRLNLAAQRAFDKTFPELARSGIQVDPRLFDIDPTSTTLGRSAQRAFRSYDAYAKFLLQPFTQAEMANQVSTFFGAKHALRTAMRTGEMEVPVGIGGTRLAGTQLDDWLNFNASEAVNALQFRPGPGSRTLWQNRLPPPLRMFTSFPVRAASMMMESTTRGALTAAQLENAGFLRRLTGGRNLGTLARIVLYGRIVQNGARDALGIDLSNVLGVTAPFNVAPPSQPLWPLPIPPIAGLAYGIGSATVQRDWKRFQPLTLPGVGDVPIPRMLFPGGLGISKFARALNQYRPDLGGFVDDDERLLYRGNDTDFLLSALGVPLDKARRAREMVGRLQAIRGRVRRIRRDAMVAAMNYDTDGLQTAQQRWSQAFPDWPPLTIQRRDLERYRNAARMTVIQRTLQTMGARGRLLERDIYNADPSLIAPPAPAGAA